MPGAKKCKAERPIVHDERALELLKRLHGGNSPQSITMAPELRPDPSIFATPFQILTESPACADYSRPARPADGR